MLLTAAVSGVAIRADQKWHMIMLRRIRDLKHDRNLRIKIIDVEFGEIVLGVEDEPVGSTRQWFFDKKEGFHPAIFVSPGMTQLGPGFIGVLDVQMDSNAPGGRAARNVKYVR